MSVQEVERSSEEYQDLDKMSTFAESIYLHKYSFDGKEKWTQTAQRVVGSVLGSLGYSPGDEEYDLLLEMVKKRKFIPGGRYLYASGRELHQTQNCLLLKAKDSREGWAELMQKSSLALMTGAGIGVDYSDVRPSGSPISKTGGIASGPIALMRIINEIGRNVMQGGSRRSAIWAGLSWKHSDIVDFIGIKNWPDYIHKMKKKDINHPADMDMTNISVILDDEFFEAFYNKDHNLHRHASHVYWASVKNMVMTGEPGFSVDIGENSGETLRNACTEISSSDSDDICNLGSINLSRIRDKDEMYDVVRLGTLFLLAGTVYSHLPYEDVSFVRSKNRRLGLGLMGVHEWLLQRGKKYEPDDELSEWLDIYAKSGEFANYYADLHGLSRPVKTRAIAPTGTIGIIGETTTGIEPIFCVAFKRRYRLASPNGKDKVCYQYVIDPTAKRLIDQGVDPSDIEDAYTLSFDVERRIAFQAWIQQWVDHCISSTINLPYPIDDEKEVKSFGNLLLKYLPQLRGITVYPNGARGGQPLTTVPYHIAITKEGRVFEEHEDKCLSGICGS